MSGSVSSSIYNTLYDPNAAMPTSAAAIAPNAPTAPANALGPQAPAVSPMWANWGGFDPVPGNSNSPYAGAVQQPSNPGFMTFQQAQAQAALPGQNPFAGVDPSHPLWQVMFNEYTNMGQTDPRVLFQQIGQRAGGYGGGEGGGVSGGGSGGHGQDASGQWG
jgi:hypothetical protein